MARCDIKKILIEKLKTINSRGIVRNLKFKSPDYYKEIQKFQIENNLDSMTEAIYWILHDIELKPVCPGYTDKCIRVLKFKSLHDGYTYACNKCYTKAPEFSRSIEKTMLEKYGVSKLAHIPGVQEKKKQTCLNKYGVESHNQLESVKRKKKQTLLKHYANGMADKEITNKKICTNLKKYNCKWATQTKEAQEKRKNTCKERYGEDHHMKNKTISKKISTAWYKNKDFLSYVERLVASRNLKLVSDYTSAHNNVTLQCLVCNNKFDILWNSFQQGGGICPYCFPLHMGKSYTEEEISLYISKLGFKVLRNKKDIISPYEIDILLPERNLAIEYCGLWCHSSGGNVPYLKDENYHVTKLNMCNKKGIRLLTIFEDEWILHKDLVIEKLKRILGIKAKIKIRASKCQISNIKFDDKNQFLNNYHLQKDKVSQINIGLTYNSNLVSLMTFCRLNDNEFEMVRFCSLPDIQVHGAAGKLVNEFFRRYNNSKIITYADRRWSDGQTYLKIGFKLDYITSPNYWYWGKGIVGRKHRLSYSKSNLKNMTSYDESLTEKEIMALEGYSWIYDCGNLRFSKSI